MRAERGLGGRPRAGARRHGWAWVGAVLLCWGLGSAAWAQAPALQPQHVTATAASPEVAHTLAPSGELRVGVYLGSPTSLLVDPNGAPYGVAVGLGQSLAEAVGRPMRLVRFERVAQVIDALRAGEVDMTFTNATAARAQAVDFTEPLLRLELGVLVAERLALTRIDQLNEAARRIGVAEGSSSQTALPKALPLAQIVPMKSLDQAHSLLRTGVLDGFATNKAILFELQARLTGFQVLDDRWGLEHLAIAMPKGREAAHPFMAEFAQQQRASGAVQALAERAGLRGMAK